MIKTQGKGWRCVLSPRLNNRDGEKMPYGAELGAGGVTAWVSNNTTFQMAEKGRKLHVMKGFLKHKQQTVPLEGILSHLIQIGKWLICVKTQQTKYML